MASLHVLCVIGSLGARSVTRVVILKVADDLRASGCDVDVLDLAQEPLPPFNPDETHRAPHFAALKARVDAANAFILGTPDYHGSISSTLKNFLDHFWHEFAGKLFATVVASHEKGLTVTDQLRTVARQCYAWSLPYGVAFMEKEDVSKDGEIVSDALKKRLAMLTRDVRVYGAVLAKQRTADLTGSEPGFMARLRK
ncbi:MAG: NAD(P)H-dependent oxidoreductase [Verrucomicrobia bacterium]|nr:NAD(P)H-dependent oxidoreductase [Verrucomicrobiota bacterium]